MKYCVLEFNDDGVTTVPHKKLLRELPNGKFQVRWSNGKKYEADLLFTGSAIAVTKC